MHGQHGGEFFGKGISWKQENKSSGMKNAKLLLNYFFHVSISFFVHRNYRFDVQILKSRPLKGKKCQIKKEKMNVSRNIIG
jgi:hypothetical protein